MSFFLLINSTLFHPYIYIYICIYIVLTSHLNIKINIVIISRLHRVVFLAIAQPHDILCESFFINQCLPFINHFCYLSLGSFQDSQHYLFVCLSAQNWMQCLRVISAMLGWEITTSFPWCYSTASNSPALPVVIFTANWFTFLPALPPF